MTTKEGVRPVETHSVLGVTTCDNGTPETGRADGCANTNIGPGRTDEEFDVGNILPLAADDVRPSPDVLRMSRIDGCPEACGNTEAPRMVDPTTTGFVAHYRCTDCGHLWFTSWGA